MASKIDSFYRFVQTLDKGELRACREYLEQKNDASGKARRLFFETMLGQKEHDHVVLQHKMRKHWDTDRMAREKHKLYAELLEVVGRVHREREGRHFPWTRFQDARTLLTMGLNLEAAEMAREGIKHAMLLEEVHVEMQLRELLRVILKGLDRKVYQAEILENDQRLETASVKTADLTAYTLIRDKLLDYYLRYRIAEGEKVTRAVNELMALPVMQNPDRASSLPALIDYHNALKLHARMENRLDDAVVEQRQTVRLWETSPQRIAYKPSYYSRALGNFIGLLTLTGNREEIPGLLKKMEAIPVSGQRDKSIQFCDIELHHQLFYMNSGRLEEALAREQQVLDGLQRFGKMIDQSYEITFRYNLGVANMLNGNVRGALRHFNDIRELRDYTQRIDLQGLARLFRLALLMVDPDSNFEHYLRNSKPFFREGDRQYSLEHHVYDWINSHYRLLKEKDIIRSFEELTVKLRQLESERMMGAEELRIWAEAHATGKPMKDIYMRQHAKAVV